MRKYRIFRFLCTKCGRCCRTRRIGETVVLYERDIVILADALGIKEDAFISIYAKCYEYNYITQSSCLCIRRIVLPCKKGCPFLEKNICSVHSFKPFQCAAWPYLEPTLSFAHYNMKSLAWCPGFGRGYVLPMDKIHKLINEQKQYESDYYSQVKDPTSKVCKWLNIMKTEKAFVIKCDNDGYFRKATLLRGDV